VSSVYRILTEAMRFQNKMSRFVIITWEDFKIIEMKENLIKLNIIINRNYFAHGSIKLSRVCTLFARTYSSLAHKCQRHTGAEPPSL
jgi:hypothetical protein